MRTLQMHINGVLDASKFFDINAKYGYRLVHQNVEPCPNGVAGCAICNREGGRKGYHPRRIDAADFAFALFRREDGQPEVLPHRWRLGPVTIETAGQVFEEGLHFTVARRSVEWGEDQGPALGAPMVARYRAHPEDFVHLQHAYTQITGGDRRAEQSLNLRFANLDQGMIAASLPSNARGYMCKEGDRFYPVDSEMRFTSSFKPERNDRGGRFTSRHELVTRVVRAYGLTAQGREVDVPCTFDAATRDFVTTGPVPAGPQGESGLVVIYDAIPAYTVWLDQGEFRNPMGQDHERLVILIREELGR